MQVREPPFKTTPLTLDHRTLRDQHHAHVVESRYALDEEVVLADIHIEMGETLDTEVELLREAQITARSAIGAATNGARKPRHRDMQAREADKIIDQPLLAFDSRIAQHHVATHKGLTHHCQPLLRGGLGIGRGEQDMLVTGRLDTHVDGHLGGDGESGVVLYLGNQQIRVVKAQCQELLVEVVIGTHIYHNNLIQSLILLRKKSAKTRIQIVVILREERHNHRYRRLLLKVFATARVAEASHAAVDDDVVVELNDE